MLAIALDVRQFTPLADFEKRVATMVEFVKSCPTAPGFEQIYVPGEIEARQREQRTREGISIDPAVWEQIQNVCARLGVDLGTMS